MEKILTFSVVTPCFNSEKYIAETIESVLSQCGPFKIQYLIIDGRSTDSTIDIIEKYAAKVKQGHYKGLCCGIDFEYVSEKDCGMYDAISKGIRKMKGDYCSYINSDDYYLPNAFKTVQAFFLYYKSRINWLTGMPNTYNAFGANVKRYLPFEYRSDFIRKGVYGGKLTHIQQESNFWKGALNKNIDFDKLSNYKYAGDYYLWHEFSKENKLWILDSILSGFRTHQFNMSKNIENYNKEFNNIISERISLFDRLSIFFHKLLWQSSYKIKRRISKSILSAFNPRLQQFYIEFEEQVFSDLENK